MTPLLTALLLLITPPGEAVANPEVVEVEAKEAAALLQDLDRLAVLDVRTEKEFRDGHIAGATRIDFLKDDFRERVSSELDPNKAYLVHCRSGSRSSRAVEVLRDLGFEKVYHMSGGMLAWQEAGLPTVTEEEATP
jgi:rhodanese-related sulfurtransferase